MSELTATDVFEAVKIAWKQDKNGYILTLSVHPNDVPPSLFTDPVGTRYQVGLVKSNDVGEPGPPGVDRAIQSAGMLCRDPGFSRYLRERHGHTAAVDERTAAQALCALLGVASRSDLKSVPVAARKMMEIADDFRTYHTQRQAGRSDLDEF